jgi:tetratricopeptide (TPR) repeat protein
LVNDRTPRRPSDGKKRPAPARDGARRTTRGAGAPKRASGRDGAPKKWEPRGSGAPKGASGRDGAPKREPRRTGAGAPKRATSRDERSGREQRRDGPQKRLGRGAPAKRTSRAGGAGRTGGDRKRTSRNSDERSPTRSGVDYPSAKFRNKNAEPAPVAPKPRSSLRKVRRTDPSTRPAAPALRRERKGRPAAPTRRRKVRTTEAGEELARLAGRNARHAQSELARAAEAFTAGRERDAARLLRPLRDAYPDASAVRELLGLCQYRLGQYAAATKELEAFVELTDSVEQHPVLMDCARALGKHRRVQELWEELAAASPSGALVTEGRIVLAGSLADQGRLTEAIATLDRRGGQPNRVLDHHARVWYALADLYERAGDLPKARDLFQRIRRYDAAFADIAERLAALG